MSAAPTAALRWAINALDEERYKDEAAAARCELLDLIEALGVARGVVAAQREALRAIELWPFDVGHTPERDLREIKERARAALDAEGVSEPGSSAAVVDTDATPQDGDGPETVGERQGRHPGSLTSPVDTAPTAADLKRGYLQAQEHFKRAKGPRGFVTSTADGPVGVYHAETPDAYLEHGDR